MIAILACLILGAQGTDGGASITVFQEDIQTDIVGMQNSNHGYVDVQFMGQPFTLYLNVTLNGQWVAINVPMRSMQGVGNTCQEGVAIPLPVPPGQNLPNAMVAWTMTPQKFNQPPNNPQPLPVQNRMTVQFPGLNENQFSVGHVRNPGIVRLSVMFNTKEHKPDPNFPNPPQVGRVCCPQSVHNAVQYLKAKHGFTTHPSIKNLDTWKIALGWNANKWGAIGCNPREWYKLKEDFCRTQGIPIRTRKLPSDKVSTIGDLLKAGCAIELTTSVHVVNVVGFTQAGNDITLDIAQDRDQREGEGGEGVEKISFRVNKNVISGGGPLLNGYKIESIIVECYEPPDDGSGCGGCTLD